MIGFCTIVFIIIFILVYPIVNPGDPLQMIGLGTFFRPGTYVSVHDALNVQRTYTLRLPDAALNRVANRLTDEDRETMKGWLVRYGEMEDIRELYPDHIDTEDVHELLALWWQYYNQEIRIEGLTIAERRAYARIDDRIDGIFDTADIVLYRLNEDTGEYEESGVVTANDYANVNEIANTITLPLGTDNFGRDVLRQLVSAAGASLIMGLVAGLIATSLGLVFGLLSGYVGGIVDDIMMFFFNLLSVIPGIVLLILISIGIGQEQRGVMIIAVVIGCTSWVWTARSVRSQVMSLRNRDHVNLSKLSGHSLPKILIKDITPYIASYVVMAFILQVSSAILAEAGLSMLGLGPKTTEQTTLGIMMQWATSFNAHINGAWWAFIPVILLIAMLSFSMNLMNTGMDQVFNPQLRD